MEQNESDRTRKCSIHHFVGAVKGWLSTGACPMALCLSPCVAENSSEGWYGRGLDFQFVSAVYSITVHLTNCCASPDLSESVIQSLCFF